MLFIFIFIIFICINIILVRQYITAFSKLAKATNTILLPSNVGDPASMVAQVHTKLQITRILYPVFFVFDIHTLTPNINIHNDTMHPEYSCLRTPNIRTFAHRIFVPSRPEMYLGSQCF